MRGNYTPEDRDIPIVVSPALVRYLGGNADLAVILQQIHYWRQFHRTDWFEASSWELADLTGFRPEKCRHLVRKLVENGHIEKRNHSNSRGEQKASYRPLLDPNYVPVPSPVEIDGQPVESDRRAPVEMDGPEPVEFDRPTYVSNTKKKITTRASADAQVVEMFPTPEPSAPAKRKPKAAPREYDAEFLAWWTKYPNKLNKADAWEAWKVVDHEAVTVALDHYLASIAAHEAKYPGATVSPLYATTFLNGKWENWEDGPQPNPYWPKVTLAGDDVAGAYALAKQLWDAAEHMPGRRADTWRELLAEHPRILEAANRCGNEFARARTDTDRLAAFQAAWLAADAHQAAS
jgi:hypothetical protein